MRNIHSMRNILRPNGNVSMQVEKWRKTYFIFYEENTFEEPNDIAIVLPRFTAPLTNAQMANLPNILEPIRHSDSHGVDIYAETVRFILNVWL